MFATSFVLAAGLFLSAAPSHPEMMTDYKSALERSVSEKKPIAVFITSGGEVSKLIHEGNLTPETTKVLKNYICLHVDASGKGKDLSGSFQMSEGIIISDKGGSLQALRHTGTVSQTELVEKLERFSNVTSVQRTEYSGKVTSSTSNYTPSNYNPFGGGCANGQCGRRY